MGVSLLKDCCANSDEANKYKDTTASDYDSNHSSFLRQSPLKEIHFSMEASQVSPIRRLSNLPIQAKNIIRKFNKNPSEIYETLALIGQGAIGKVYKIKSKLTGQIRAMKEISKTLLRTCYTKEEIENEIEILKAIGHPNIIKIYEVYQDEECYYIINEYCSDGDLCQVLMKAKRLDESIVQKLMYQIFSSVAYLHSQNIIHGDLKLENVMIDSETDNNNKLFIDSIQEDTMECKLNHQCWFARTNHYGIKLIDFGCSKLFRLKENVTNGTLGTLFYCSPEMLNNNYNEKSDIWSCGVIMYMLLAGEIPFKGPTDCEIKEKILSGQFCFYNRLFRNISAEAKDLIRQCFIYNPAGRINAKQALTHSFFQAKHSVTVLDGTNSMTKEVFSSLTHFSSKSKLFQVVLAYLAHNYVTKEEIAKSKSTFYALDTDGDGRISKEELRKGFSEMGMMLPQKEIDQIVKRIDFDNDGYINYPEFLQATIQLDHLFNESNLLNAYKVFDTQNSGVVSVKGLEEILGMSPGTDSTVVSQLLKEINKAEDDELPYEEFKKIILDNLRMYTGKSNSDDSKKDDITQFNGMNKVS